MKIIYGQAHPAAEETTAEFLDRREKELLAQVSALRGQLAPREAELATVRKMKASLVHPLEAALGTADVPEPLPPMPPMPPLLPHINARSGMLGSLPTIKELVIQAMLDHFPQGASANQIRDFIRDAYGRNVNPASLRPQMHRLKADDKLLHDPATDTWNLTNQARRLYAMYDHPTSRRAMRELQDDPDDDALLKAATELAWREPEKD